jgi:hypothetical protein
MRDAVVVMAVPGAAAGAGGGKSGSGGGGGGAGGAASAAPCAACKLLRRRCAAGCVFAPYFPPGEPHKFANVHKVFGASNVSKLLQVQRHAQPPLCSALLRLLCSRTASFFSPHEHECSFA